MSRKTHIGKTDVNKAWDTLYSRLQEEQLLDGTHELIDEPTPRPRRVVLQWAAAFVVLIASGLTILHITSQKESAPLLAIENTAIGYTLVKTLEDGTTVFLKGNSTLLVPEKFENNQRLVSLKGEAVFSVSKDPNRPFIVKTSGGDVEVLGTTFSVKSSSGETFELLVEEGAVKVSKEGIEEHMIVKTGEKAILSENKFQKSPLGELVGFSRNFGQLSFKDERLDNVVRALNSISSQKIILANEQLNSRTLTVTFDAGNAPVMADLICLALNLKQNKTADTIYITQP